MVKSLRQFLPIFANSAAFGKVVALLDHTGIERPNLLRVLTYQALFESLRGAVGVDALYLDYLAQRYFA